jgi:hypothetical protein
MPQAAINRDQIVDHVTAVDDVASLLIAEVERIPHDGGRGVTG